MALDSSIINSQSTLLKSAMIWMAGQNGSEELFKMTCQFLHPSSTLQASERMLNKRSHQKWQASVLIDTTDSISNRPVITCKRPITRRNTKPLLPPDCLPSSVPTGSLISIHFHALVRVFSRLWHNQV